MLHLRRRARVTVIVRYVRYKEHSHDIVDQTLEVGDKERTQSSAVSDTDVRLHIPTNCKWCHLVLQGAHVLQ